MGGLTIVNVSHDEANGILWRRHFPTTVAIDGDLYAIHHTILAAANLIAENEFALAIQPATLAGLNLAVGSHMDIVKN